ncbi:MAG TPA: PAS domain-containing protein [Burkholderiaceae bacterium]|nr:PAS domain-containing protein [Burkholderiaceae bacterium]
MTEPLATRRHLPASRFLLIVVAVAVVSYLLLALWARDSHDAALERAASEIEALAQLNSAALGLHLRNARRAAEELANAPQIDERTVHAAHAARLNGTDLLDVFDRHGHVLATTASEPAAAPASLVDQFTDEHRLRSSGLGWAYERQGRYWLPVIYRQDDEHWIVVSLPIENILASWARPRWTGLNPIGLRSGTDRILLRFPFSPDQLGKDAAATSSAALLREAVLRGVAHGNMRTMVTETEQVERLIGWALVPGSMSRALVATDVANVRAEWLRSEGSKFGVLAALIALALASWVGWRFRIVAYQRELQRATVLNSQALDASADTTWVMRHDERIELGEGAPWLRELLQSTARSDQPFDALLQLAEPEDAQRFRQTLQACSTRPAPFEQLLEFRDRKGRIRSVLVRGAPLQHGQPHGDRMVGTLRDITELADAHRTIRSTTQTLERACELALIGPWHVDAHNLQLTLSDTAKRIYGLPADFGPMPWLEFQGAGGADQVRLSRQRKRLLETGEGYSELCSFQRGPQGEVRWIKSVASPVFKDERLVSVEGSVQDVTSLIETQGRLHAHEKTNLMLSTALEVSSQAVAITDEQGLISWTNQAYLKRTGLSALDVLDRQIESTLPDVSDAGSVVYPSLGELTQSLRGTGTPRIRVRNNDEVCWFDVEVQRISAGDDFDDALVWVLTEVTHDVRREAALQDATRRFELATRNAAIGIWEIDFVRDKSHWNDALYSMFGLAHCDQPLSVADVAARVHPEDQPEAQRSWEAAVKQAAVADTEFRVRGADGQWHWLKSSFVIERDARGRATRAIGTTVDTTVSHEIEAERSSRQIAEAQTQAKNTFLSRMSHELRTPLNAIIGYTQLLRQRLVADKPADERLARVESAGWHLLSLIDEVLDLSRIESGTVPLHPIPVSLERVLPEALALVEPQFGKARVTLEYTPTAAWVHADPKRLKQIVTNLLSNAAKYNRPGGHVWVTVGRAGDQISIAVRDDGLGMDAEQLTRLFSPFDRLGRDLMGIEGTGIGLTICKTLAERMNGTLSVRSETEVGSVFELCLPAAEPVSTVIAPRDAHSLGAASVRRVLCVEDNLVNALLLEEALHTAFPLWHIGRAASVAQARGTLQAERFDYVLLDLNLPDGQGVHLLDDQSIREHLPPDHVILLTADATEQAAQLSSRYGLRGVLTKPFKLSALSDMLS